MNTTLLAATSNPGKLRDFSMAASVIDGSVRVEALPGIASIAAPEEDQDTFEGNATLKAMHYSRFAPGAIVLADDSGLEVDALNGAPGVRSARYADDMGLSAATKLDTDARNNFCLMAALKDIALSHRTARYRCVLVAVLDGSVVSKGGGAVEGCIVLEPRGTGGFGYDPYFVPEGMGETMAELSPEVRLGLSHRGRALRNLVNNMRVAQI